MSDASRRRMISAYIERSAQPRQFLAGFFQSPPENFHSSEEVEIDIQRSGEDVAIVVQDLSAGGRQNQNTLYTNKRFKPALYDERFNLNSYDLIKRRAGADPFGDVDFLSDAAREFMSTMRKVEDKIRRGVELQASQVLQTGRLTLADSSGVALFELDYKPKATHFPTSSTSWGSVGAAPLTDLESLADVILTDGKAEAGRLVFGKTALRRFLADSTVQSHLDNRRMDLGAIAKPTVGGSGGKFHGTISIGQYTFEIWSYAGWYTHPQTSVATPYVHEDKVVMLSDGRLDLTFGAIPRLAALDPRVAPFVPGRVANAAGGMDMDTSAWLSPDGTVLHGAVKARPLCIPTAIDTFGCLDTTA